MSLSNQNGSFPQGKLPFLYLFQQGRLITVTLSSFLIDRVQDFTFRRPVRDSE